MVANMVSEGGGPGKDPKRRRRTSEVRIIKKHALGGTTQREPWDRQKKHNQDLAASGAAKGNWG